LVTLSCRRHKFSDKDLEAIRAARDENDHKDDDDDENTPGSCRALVQQLLLQTTNNRSRNGKKATSRSWAGLSQEQVFWLQIGESPKTLRVGQVMDVRVTKLDHERGAWCILDCGLCGLIPRHLMPHKNV